MKKVLLLSSVVAMAVSAANADYRTVYTNNCDPAAMQALLARESDTYRAVITEVICESARVVAEPAPVVYEAAYAPIEPVYVEPTYDLANIPVVDCVPGPIACGCGTCGC